MKVVCLASGGIDSSLLMYMLKKKNHEIFPLYVDYGHKSAKMEFSAYQKICRFLDITPEVIKINEISKISSGLTDPSISPIEHPFFPARNLLFLTIGASYAYEKSIRIIAIGLLDNAVFPDQTKEFIKNAETAICSAIGSQIKILNPLIELDKREVIALAKKYEFPLGLTYSCHVGSSEPCGKCMGCKERLSAENRYVLTNSK